MYNDHNSEERGRQDAPLMKYSAAWRRVQLENRVESYMTAILVNSASEECTMTQTKLAKRLKMRRQTLVDILNSLVAAGRLTRFELPNGRRSNVRHGYTWGQVLQDEARAFEKARDSYSKETHTYTDLDQDSSRSEQGEDYVRGLDHRYRSPVEMPNLDPNKGKGFFAKNPFDF